MGNQTEGGSQMSRWLLDLATPYMEQENRQVSISRNSEFSACITDYSQRHFIQIRLASEPAWSRDMLLVPRCSVTLLLT
jgi:hypothetical protein